MTADVQTACNDMNGMVSAIMAQQWPDADIRWQGKGNNLDPPAADKKWVRVTILHANGTQASLAGADGTQRWNEVGTLVVQCFCPVDQGGLDKARAMATSLRAGFRGKASPNQVWFRDPSIREVGRDMGWEQVNFSVTFTYDDVQ